MTTAPHTGWFTGRTRLITIVSILAVGVAGATAVGANIGILTAASESNVGSATAGDLTADTQVVDVYLPATAASTTAPPTSTAVAQEFAVDAAGSVAVAATDTGLRFDRATPTLGWTWNLTQTSPDALMVTFTNGTRTLEFTASRNADGSIAAAVNEPIITAAPPSGGGGGGGDDDHESDDGHEGGGDDD